MPLVSPLPRRWRQPDPRTTYSFYYPRESGHPSLIDSRRLDSDVDALLALAQLQVEYHNPKVYAIANRKGGYPERLKPREETRHA